MITIALVISALFATVGCRAAAHSDLLLDNYSMSTRSTNSVIIDSRQQDTRSLKRVFLSNRTITCNDGSQAGFFLRKSPGSLRWVVFFEGGDRYGITLLEYKNTKSSISTPFAVAMTRRRAVRDG